MITTLLRTLILYVLVTFGIRIMGKRQIGDMQPNELVITLMISEVAAIPLQDTSQPIFNGMNAIFVLVILEIIMSVLAMKNLFIKKLMSGKSVVVIKNGVIDQHAMKNVRMTVIELIEQLRGQNVFDISTVAFAILEVNGDLSVLLKASEQPVTTKDLNIKVKEKPLPLPVISDGKILNESLEALETDRNVIEKKLKEEKTNAKNVFLMTMDRDCKYTIIKKRDK